MVIVNRGRVDWEIFEKERESLVPSTVPVYVEHEYIIEEIIHTVEELLKMD